MPILDRDIEDTRQPKEYPQCPICDAYLEQEPFTGEWFCPKCESEEEVNNGEI